MKECARCLACFEDTEEHCSADGAELQTTLDGPPLVDRKYRLERRLSQGGMGVVYLACHVELQKRFAVKLIRATASRKQALLARFRLEAEALGRLKHPGIVDVTDFGIDPREDGLPYLVMERLEGTSLDEYCETRGPMSAEDALPILKAVADAMDFAHRRGVLHRDLKPANVFLAVTASNGRVVKLLDFGLARLAEEQRPPAPTVTPGVAAAGSGVRSMGDPNLSDFPTAEMIPQALTPQAEPTPVWRSDSPLTALGSVAGTPLYMAPERFQSGESSAATDIYALGVLAFKVLTGRLPFEGPADAVVSGHLNDRPPKASSLRPALIALDDALLAALEKDPARRPVSGAAFVACLRRAGDAARVRLWWRAEAPHRLAIAAALAGAMVLSASALSSFGPVEDLERRSIDLRFRMLPLRSPDQRLLLAVLDESSLPPSALGTTEMADQIGERLERVFAAGARGVAIDLLCPEAWGRSQAFSGLVLRHHEALTLAATATAEGGFVGPECVSGMTAVALGDAASDLFGIVNLEEDQDGVLRRARLGYRDRETRLRATWALHAARRLLSTEISTSSVERPVRFWVDQSADSSRFRRLSWKDLPRALEQDPSRFAGSLVMLGAELDAGDEGHRLPARGDATADVPGVVGQAMIADTILAGFPVRDLRLPRWLAGFGAWATLTGLSLAILCSPKPERATLFGALLLGVYIAGNLILFVRARQVIPMAAPVLIGTVATAAALALARRLPVVPRLEAEAA